MEILTKREPGSTSYVYSAKSVFSQEPHNHLVNEKRKICHFHLQIRSREAGRLSGCPKFSQEVTGYYGESQEHFVLRKSMSTATERSMEGGHF